MVQLKEPYNSSWPVDFHDPKHPLWDVELKYLTTDPQRMDWVAEFVNEISQTGNTLVFVNSLDAADSFLKRLPNAIQCDGRVKPSVREKRYAEFDTMDNAQMVCTVQVASTGIDIVRVFNVIFYEPGKSFITVIQALGRGLRRGEDKDHLNLYDVHSNTKYSKKHAAERKKYFVENRHKITVTKASYLRDS